MQVNGLTPAQYASLEKGGMGRLRGDFQAAVKQLSRAINSKSVDINKVDTCCKRVKECEKKFSGHYPLAWAVYIKNSPTPNAAHQLLAKATDPAWRQQHKPTKPKTNIALDILGIVLLPFCIAGCGNTKHVSTNRAATSKPDLPAPPVPKEEINAILGQSWKHYKNTMIASDGRPLADPDNSDIDGDGNTVERQTNSEAVSYCLLRAVYMNDKATFDKVWKWARKNMQRKNMGLVYDWNNNNWTAAQKKDSLFAWRYVPSLKGKAGGVINYKWCDEPVWRGCFEVATDADQDIAAALIMAGNKWEDTSYIKEAKSILNDLWKECVIGSKGNYYMAGGDQFKDTRDINPSYMRPSYYDTFEKVDIAHPWHKLTDSSYKVIAKSGDITLLDENGNSNSGGANLPANWIKVSSDDTFSDSGIFMKQGGSISGWDAFRTHFWVAKDYVETGNPNAKKYLADNRGSISDMGPYHFFKDELSKKGHINAGYTRDGKAVSQSGWWSNNLNREEFAMDGAYLSYFYAGGDKQSTQKMYSNLQKKYHPQGYWGDNPNDYYGQNWAWFGLSLLSGKGAIGSIKTSPSIGSGVKVYSAPVSASSHPAPAAPPKSAPAAVKGRIPL